MTTMNRISKVDKDNNLIGIGGPILEGFCGKKEWKDITTDLWDQVMRARKHNSKIRIILEVEK